MKSRIMDLLWSGAFRGNRNPQTGAIASFFGVRRSCLHGSDHRGCGLVVYLVVGLFAMKKVVSFRVEN